MKKALLLYGILLFNFSVFSQSYVIKGKLVDTTNAPLSFSSVFLLRPADSTLVTFVRADENGAFTFKNIKKQDYLIKTTFVGLFPYQQLIKYEFPDRDLGTITLKPILKELYEVVIRTAKAPIEIRGDTIEYDARKFKVPSGSSVEDLLRKLPGMQVDAEGNIKAQGEKVQKLLVDGKRFFGDDPKLATKNLPAEAINKVQVFNDKTDQAKLTGIEDGKHEKTINLELKEEFKKGGFGKITAGAGTDERAIAKGNYNKFDSKNQFSVIGFGNNLNQTGLSNNDYQDFKGSQSYQWNDNADFGFSQGGMRFFYFGEDDDDLEPGMNIPQSWGAGQGLSKNFAGGLNYNYDTKKTKVSTNYFYNQTNQTLNQTGQNLTFLGNTRYNTLDSGRSGNFIENHRISFRVEKELDSLNTIVLNFNGRMSDKSQNTETLMRFENAQNEIFRAKQTLNRFEANSNALSIVGIYRHKFRKKGRNFALSGGINNNDNDQNSNQKSTFNAFKVNGDKFDLGNVNLNVNQNVLGLSKNQELKTSVLYTEPLTKKLISETFYNHSTRNQEVDRDVFSLFTDNRPRVDSLSRFFENKILFDRIGSSLRITNGRFNLSVGAAYNQILIDGSFYNDQNKPLQNKIENRFSKVVPNMNLNFELKAGGFLNASYDVGFAAPEIRDLQPFIDNSNPMFINVGNPSLKPTTSRTANFGFGKFNQVSFKQFWSNIYFTQYVDQVVRNQTVDSRLITTLNPVNVSGGQNLGLYLNYGFPIIKTKATMGFDLNLNYGKSISFINAVSNDNTNINYRPAVSLDLTPVNWLSSFFQINVAQTNAKYSIDKNQNQKYNELNISNVLNVQMPKLWFFTADFNYGRFENKRQGFLQNRPILHLSTYKVMGKAKKSELRLTFNDVFKKNLGISQGAYENTVSRVSVQTLSRYIMLSYTYNMRGVNAKIKKNKWD